MTGTVLANTSLGQRSLLVGNVNTRAYFRNINPSRLDFGDNSDFTGTSSFSVEAWIKPESAAITSNSYIYSKQNSTIDGWATSEDYLHRSDSSPSRTAASVTQNALVDAAGVIVANTIYHVVGTLRRHRHVHLRRRRGSRNSRLLPTHSQGTLITWS